MPLVSSFYEFTLTEDYMLQFTTQCKIKKTNKQKQNENEKKEHKKDKLFDTKSNKIHINLSV